MARRTQLSDDLDLKSYANAFVDEDEHKLAIVGRFTDDNCVKAKFNSYTIANGY